MNLTSKILSYYNWFINPNGERIVSKKIYLNFLILISFGASFLILIISYFLKLNLVFLYTLLIFLGLIVTWFSNRYIKKPVFTLSLAFIGLIVLFNLFYFANNGFYGPVAYFLFPFAFIVIYFSERKMSYFFYTVLLINIIILAYIEIKIPQVSVPYKERDVQYNDHYATIIITSVVMIVLLFNIIKLQINEKKIAKESNKLKTTFLANTSHDIRTPVNAIVGFCKLLNNEDLTKSELRKYVNIIHTNNNQLLNLINDIFDISIIDSGNFKLHKKHINLNTLIEEIYSNSKLSIETSGKNILLKAHHGLPETQCVIFADSVRINQVLSNLIQNSIKYTEIGAIIFGYDKKVKSNVLEFYVKDTGCGIPEKELDNIFNRYVTNINQSKSIKGIGLGLHITNSLVKLMGGKIRVQSKQNEGTQFFFTLPLDE